MTVHVEGGHLSTELRLTYAMLRHSLVDGNVIFLHAIVMMTEALGGHELDKCDASVRLSYDQGT